MNRESLTDQELVNLTIKNRDQKAFGILYDRYHLKNLGAEVAKT